MPDLAFPIAAVRVRFPALTLRDNGMPRVYLDNPAGTQVPQSVADAIARCLIETNANLGGFFTTSRAAEASVVEAHRAMARFVGARSEREIVIGPSMTALTFVFAQALAERVQPGDEIVVTRADHEGNVSPWLMLAQQRGAVIRWVPFDPATWAVEPESLAGVLGPRTRIVALNYAGNLTGTINPTATLCALARAAGALSYVDAVQFAPHGRIDVRALGCDVLTLSPYKFFGPHLGVLWGREELLAALPAQKVRPQTDELPWRFETGTPQIEAQAGLVETVRYFDWLAQEAGVENAFEAIVPWERALAARLLDGLRSLPDVRIAGLEDAGPGRVPTVSFTHRTRPSAEIAEALARHNVFVWSGHNFALEAARAIGVDEADGVVRVGPVHYNTLEEIDAALGAL